MEAKRLIWFFWKFSIILNRFQNRSSKIKLYICMCILTFCATNIYLLMLWNCTVPDRATSFRLIQKQLWDSIGNNSEEIGCVFPVLDPFSEQAMRFIRNVSKIKCEGEDWVDCYLSQCGVKKEILNRFQNVVCNYKDIVYVNDDNYFVGAATRVTGEGKYYLNRSDHVKVSCSGNDKTGLGLLASRWFGYKGGLRPITRTAPPGREDSINVLILAFDSTSRNSFVRLMPKSYNVLTKELQGTVLKGYQIVGDGTSAALFPLLTGKTALEHPETRSHVNGQYVDPKWLIFHDLKMDGYRTAYFEDSPWVGTFQYGYNGFSASPADHYLYPFFQEVFGLGLKRLTSSKYCLGAMPQYLFMLNLTRQFMKLEGKKFCLNFIADITHDDLSMITASDDDVVEFLREFKKLGRLKNTLLIVMGDHGSRYGPARQTYQGKIEERLPLMVIVLPETLMHERPEALSILKENDNVLLTPFDLHTALLDFVGLKNLANEIKVPGSKLPRGMSFLERIPKSRNCGQAAILPHWCSCATKWSNVSITHPMYERAAMTLAQFINNITLEQRELCVERTLTSIDWVMVHLPSFLTDSRDAKPYIEDYQAKIVMAPGRAVYEGTMKHFAWEDRFTISESEISRTTAYRDEPHCVTKSHPHLGKYCYCKNEDWKNEEDTVVFK